MSRAAPDIASILGILQEHEVDYVLAGSVAVQAWGADVGEPGDLDIIPAPDAANLERLTTVLADLDATAFPVTGKWRTVEGVSTWYEFDEDDPRRSIPLPQPNPADMQTFDSLFATKHGTLDIVPHISGSYAQVSLRASKLTVHGVPAVPVMGVDDLLSKLLASQRAKDAPRIAHLQAISAR